MMIEVDRLTKEFTVNRTKAGLWGAVQSLFSREREIHVAVDELSFIVEAGEFVSLIGPNGAGKSTTMKMLSGILHPTRGNIQIMGLDPRKERKRLAYQIGIVFGQRTQLWWDLPLRDSYEILRRMYRLTEKAYRDFLERYDHLLELGAFLETPVRKLSLGQRMRADLAAALIHDPPLLFLDEPTIGLDVVAKKRIRDALKELQTKRGKTILLTTHDMDDIEQLCERVIILHRGKKLLDGSIDELYNRFAPPSAIQVHFLKQPSKKPLHAAMKVEGSGESYRFLYDRRRHSASEVLKEIEQWGNLADVKMMEPDIEEVIRQIYQES